MASRRHRFPSATHPQRARPLTTELNPTTTCHPSLQQQLDCFSEEAQATFCSCACSPAKQTALSASRTERRIHQGKENPPGQREIHPTQGKQADQRKDLERKLNERQERIKKTESNLQRSIDQNKNAERQLKKDQEKLTQRLGALEKKQQDLEADHSKAIEALEKLSGMTADEAKSNMVEQMKSEARAMAATQAQDIIDEPRKRPTPKPRKSSSKPSNASPPSTAWRTASRCSNQERRRQRPHHWTRRRTSARWKRRPAWSSLWTTPPKPSS